MAEFDRSLYIDNSVVLQALPEALFAASDLSSGLCLAAHPDRETVLEESAAVHRARLDEAERVLWQLSDYHGAFPEILGARPYWTGILLRDHRNPAVTRAMKIWLAHLCTYSRRDQLTANLAFALAGIEPGFLAVDAHESPYHVWPVSHQRKIEIRVCQTPPDQTEAAIALQLLEMRLMTMATHNRELQKAHDQARHHYELIAQSTSWRMLAPLRALVHGLRKLRAP